MFIGLTKNDAVLGKREKWLEPYCGYGENRFLMFDNEMRVLRRSYNKGNDLDVIKISFLLLIVIQSIGFLLVIAFILSPNSFS